MARIIDTVLLMALPASGKSEVRKYLEGLDPAQCRDQFHLGPTVQLDDFPYVHLMRRIDDEIAAEGGTRMFFQAPDKPFQNARDWLTLVELVNEDYADMVRERRYAGSSASETLYDRLDGARARVGIPALVSRLPRKLRDVVASKIEKEAAAQLKEKQEAYPGTLEGKTVVIEFARGGPHGSSLPLPFPLGYQASVSTLAPVILEKATILYIWVTPEESRRKNTARTNPDDPGSILHHGVPIDVMMGDYGLDDMEHLLGASGHPDAIKVASHGRDYVVPVVRFDNRVDKTSFVRNARSAWKPEEIKALDEGLHQAFSSVHARLV